MFKKQDAQAGGVCVCVVGVSERVQQAMKGKQYRHQITQNEKKLQFSLGKYCSLCYSLQLLELLACSLTSGYEVT